MQFNKWDNLQLDKPLLKQLKTQDELKRHSLDKTLENKPVDRALHILSKGDDIQKLNIIQSLPHLLAGDIQTCIDRVLPKMQQSLPTASTEFHIAASTTFKTILEQKLVSHTIFTQIFLQSILTSLESRDPVISHAWLETLLDVIELLPLDVIRGKILPLTVNKGQMSQPISARVMSCKLLGKMCTRFDSISIKKEILPTVHSLCQDVNSEVRACICLQLRYVAEGLGAESVKQSLLPSLVELASDESSVVREASVQTIVYLLPQLQQDTIKGTIAPLIRKLCENALTSEDRVICVISQEFGKFVLGIEKCLTAAEKTWMIQYFQQLAHMGIPSANKDESKEEIPFYIPRPYSTIKKNIDCRQQCAFNIPAMFMFASTTAETVNVLLPTLSDLTNDYYSTIRRTIACSIHEVANVLGSDCGLIKGEFIQLLKDDMEEVWQGLVPHLARILELMTLSQTIGTENIDSNVTEIGKALLKCENEVASSNNWRLAALMLGQLEILHKCFPSDFIYTSFVPMAMSRILTARPLPIRLAAGRTFLIYLRYNLKAQQRTEMRNRIYTDLARNSNCYVRMLFIRMMIEAMTIFSSVYIKEHFYITLLNMAEDPVANIRLKLVTLLPDLKRYLRLPVDKKLLAALEATIRTLMNNEKDRDVKSALTKAIAELDEIEVMHDGQTPTDKSNKNEMENIRKYEEEKKLATMTASGGKSTTVNHQTAGSPSKRQSGPPKLVTSSRTLGELSSASKPTTRHNSLYSSNTIPGVQSVTKERQAGIRNSGTNDKQKSPGMRQTPNMRQDIAKASTSSTDLATNWARLTSNSMLLTTQPWEPLRSPESGSANAITTNPVHESYLPKLGTSCSCYESLDLIFRTRMFMSNEQQQPCCSRFGDEYDDGDHLRPAKSSLYANRFDYGRPLSHAHEDKRGVLQNLLTRTSLGKYSSFSHDHHHYSHNPYWAFSSMPEIPVTLLDDEFIVDAGIRMPSQLVPSQSTSKIPKLQDIIYRNRRFNQNGFVQDVRNRRCSGFSTTNTQDRRISSKRYSMEYEDCLEQKSNGNCANISGRDSIDYEEGMRRHVQGKQQFFGDDGQRFRRRYSGFPGKQPQQESDTFVDELKKLQKNRNCNDQTKRHSMSVGMKQLSEVNDPPRHRFRRYSMEVPNFIPSDRGGHMIKRYSTTLDMNHNNQGMSKIPLRSGQLSGSRTAPATRAPIPTRLESPILSKSNKQDGCQSLSSDKESPDDNIFDWIDEGIERLYLTFY